MVALAYKELKAGDVRQERDEKRRRIPTGQHLRYNPSFVYSYKFFTKHSGDFEFHPTDLVGHVILQSDLMIFEFRRPLL